MHEDIININISIFCEAALKQIMCTVKFSHECDGPFCPLEASWY